ncbi:hypothetical protein [Gordonia sp. 852002-51296_SCH5728562-b]|uniref:hypothetical protein n=1 Tax=Gordonia sp. 852002-51296_SCH5728562-b TaxID=1834101 RepID=UPI0007EA80BA|nr:hypothetical protein [Gordonia sp. 852002-51296_SCH5728562-b]OBA32881.1 hypothetical protein A5766_12510 [Gordonia sp. 852002-51296_SCH5728562-b]
MPAPSVDLDAFHVLGQLTGRAWCEGRLDATGLAQVCRHVLGLDLERARAVLSPSAPTPITAQRN